MFNTIGRDRINKGVALIRKQMQGKTSFSYKLKNGCTVSVAKGNYGPEEYTLYAGCELIVGDTSIEMISKTMCQMSDDTRENLERQFGSFCGFDEEDSNNRSTSSNDGDYSPSNPWNAPGMSIKDFI